jgi:3-oxoacyl-[acyl-carrier-protein] synthase II
MDVFIQFALAASQFAVDDARLQVTPDIADGVGVFIASGIGGFQTIEREHIELMKGGPRRISPFFIPASIINLAAGQVSIRFGARGPNLATCTACTASAHAIGEAFEIIRRGDADIMIAGGSEAAITPMGSRLRRHARALDAQRRADAREPPVRQGSRRLRHGRGLGDRDPRGARVARSARRDDLRRRSSATACRPTPSTSPRSRRRQRRDPVDAMALRKAGVRPDQIDYINAHGTSTPINDPTETLAVKRRSASTRTSW